MSKLIKVRSFNDKGIMRLLSFIKETRSSENEHGELLPPPIDLLEDEECLESIDFAVKADVEKKFKNRYDFAVYLNNIFGGDFKDHWFENHGLWAWLAFAYFDQLRHTKLRRLKGGTFATQHEANFISDKWRKAAGQPKWYRQAVSTPLLLVKDYGEKARFFINSKTMSAMGDIIEQLLSDPKIMSSKKIIFLLIKQYSGKDGFAMQGTTAYSSPAKAKAGSRTGFGKLRRLTDGFLPRIKLTHDIDIMEDEKIIDACGPEFQKQ